MGRSREFRIALIGDFSGRASRDVAPRAKLAGVKAVSVDPDNFEQVMERMGVEVRIGENATLRFHSLEDFHPDEIFFRTALFEAVRKARAEVRTPAPAAQRCPVEAERAPLPTTPGLSLLDAIVGAAPAGSKPRDLWNEAIQSLVAPHVIPKADPGQQELRARLDSVAAGMMRVILAHPDFQAVEAAWRSVFFLLRHLETSEVLNIELIDISREELLADLHGESDARKTGLWRLLVDRERPLSVVAGLYTFGASAEEFAALERVAQIAKAAGAPFIGGAPPGLAGSSDLLNRETANAWQRMRRAPEAPWLALAMPRFLLRLPYGKGGGSVESFEFEEMPNPPDHEKYLWGNPSVACVCLLGETFQTQGFQMRAGSLNQIEGMPIHCFGDDEVTPAAEMCLTESDAEELLDHGLMPLASVKHIDAVQLVSFRSVAEPAATLAGFWNPDEA